MKSEITTTLKNIPNAKVLCIGDIILDIFVEGTSDRLSPEAPVPVVLEKFRRTILGGVGNVAHNVKSLGATPYLLSVTGNDAPAETIKSLLSELMDSNQFYIETDASRPTSTKTRYYAGMHQMLRADIEQIHQIDLSLSEKILKDAQSLIDQVDVVILSDYAKGVLTPSLTKNLILLAHEYNKPVLVDPKGTDFSKYQGADYIKPNTKELLAALGCTPNQRDEIQKAVTSLNIRGLLVTKGRDGISLYRKDHDYYDIPAYSQDIFDVSGAGDTVIAAFAAGIGAGTTPELSASIANIAAAIVVSKTGTATVTPHEILSFLQNHPEDENKFYTEDEVVKKVRQWQRKGYTVGFTNGCFDLIHPGHISILQQAKAQCNYLVLGLNSDISVQKLKGPERPIQNEWARAQVLAAFKEVDAIVLFEDESVQRLVEVVRPDVLIKGSDYKIEQVAGAKFVQSYGGRVYLADLVKDQSTSNIVKKMNNK
jgi:D-beta-D-heptose 7-phosphate kinase/D-beta-D-heptose 1-phosphate adenosyltransferase